MLDNCHILFAKLMRRRNLDQPSFDHVMFSYQENVPGNFLDQRCGANNFLGEWFSQNGLLTEGFKP